MIMQERWRAITHILEADKRLPLSGRTILEVAVGGDSELARLMSLGAMPTKCTRVDLLSESTEEGPRAYPNTTFRVGHAAKLTFPDAQFDLIFLSAVLSSIPDHHTRYAIAGEVEWVLRPGGALLWYDVRYWSPGNRSFRAVSRRELRRLFPGLRTSLQTITLIPPLARRLRGATRTLYPMLAAIPILRSYLVGLLIKPGGDRAQGPADNRTATAPTASPLDQGSGTFKESIVWDHSRA